MKNHFKEIYHTSTLLHHLYAFKYATQLDYNKSTDQRVVEMEQFIYRYFTSGNLAIQMVFLALSVVADAFYLLPEKVQKYEKSLLMLKGYIFASLMFPCTLYSAGMFWGLYYIDREYVLPAVADIVLPGWLNHSVHTLILIPLIMEILITDHVLPSSKAAFVGLSVYVLIYDVVLFYTYYQHRRWLYGLFSVLNWQERIGFVLVSYLLLLSGMKVGFALLQYKRKRKSVLDLDAPLGNFCVGNSQNSSSSCVLNKKMM